MTSIETIRRSRADLIFTHYAEDYILGHITTNSFVRPCAMQACLPVLASDSPALNAPPVIFMGATLAPFIFPATHFVDTSGVEDEKIALLLLHQSQFSEGMVILTLSNYSPGGA